MFYNKNKREKIFKSIFYHGFNDREKILDATIFFTNHILHMKTQMQDMYTISPEKRLENLKDEAAKIFLQFYRFVYLNDEMSTDENGCYKMTQKRKKKFFDYEEIQAKDIRPLIEKRINGFLAEGKMMKTKAGIYFNRQQEAYYYRPYYNGADETPDDIWWTEEIYYLLSDIKDLEDIDKIEYYKAWIETKLQRAINCNYGQEKIDMIQQVKTSFENREKKLMEKNRTNKNIENDKEL